MEKRFLNQNRLDPMVVEFLVGHQEDTLTFDDHIVIEVVPPTGDLVYLV
jgi:hypothetical protein